MMFTGYAVFAKIQRGLDATTTLERSKDSIYEGFPPGKRFPRLSSN
jgi:hypothetical protein